MGDIVTAPSQGIAALPETTVRQLGSTNVLRDPSSVVKELIDNALDARTNAIFVDIAANTLDSIQVKDTGHGITAEDRALLCRRYCTSKIRDFRDLEDIGGKWLGFRGEALASMAEMSGTLEVVTRVEGESVAFKLKYGRDGELKSTEHASAPVGTTVKITNFLQNLPVRRGTALKESAKVLSSVRHLMQSYAFARPSVRFSLRVLKAKSNKGDFMYAPKKDANIEDTALKIIGKSCALQCGWTALQSDGYDVRAFLPKADADVSKVAHEGVFLSVDGRPISTRRGTPKKIVTIYKQRLRQTGLNLRCVKDAFLCMYIACPPGSYDPNIEPSKDDVLFEREDVVLDAVRKLFAAHFHEVAVTTEAKYDSDPPTPVQKTSDKGTSSPLHVNSSIRDNTDSNYDPRPDTTFSILEEVTPSADTDRATDAPPIWRSSMYGIDQEDLELLDAEAQPPVIEDDEEQRRAANASNPWTIAKMSASIKSKHPAGNGQLITPAKSHRDATMGSSSPVRTDTRRQMPLEPQTPQTVSKACVSSLPYIAHTHHIIEQSSPVPTTHHEMHGQRNAPTRDGAGNPDSTPAAISNRELSSPLQARRSRESQQPYGTQHMFDAAERRSKEKRGYGRPTRGQAPFKPPRPQKSRRRPEFDALAFDRGEPAQVLNSENNTDIRNFLGRGRAQRPQATSHEPVITLSPFETVRRPFRPPRIVDRERIFPTGDLDAAVPRPTLRASSAEPLQRVRRNKQTRQYMSNSHDFINHACSPNSHPDPDLSTHPRPRALSAEPESTPMIQRPRTQTSDLEMTTLFATYTDAAQAPKNPQLPIPVPPTAPAHRTPITRLQRRRSSRLPLEHVPPSYRLHNVVLWMNTSPRKMVEEMQNLDMGLNTVAWRSPANASALNAFGTKIPDQVLRTWALRLDSMLEHFDTQLDSESAMVTLERGIAAALKERHTVEEQEGGLGPSSGVPGGEIMQPGREGCVNALDQIREWAEGVYSTGEDEKPDGSVSAQPQDIDPAPPVNVDHVVDEFGGDDIDDEMLMDI